MPYQPAILGTARLGNFRLGYRPAALTAVRATKVRVTLSGVSVSDASSATRTRMTPFHIHDAVNDQPNTCDLVVQGTAPIDEAPIRVTINSDTPRLLFNGTLQTRDRSYEGTAAHLAFPVTAIDDGARANRRRPYGTWVNVSATTIGQYLVSVFAPGFTSVHVQAALPAVSIIFDGSETWMAAWARLATAFGGYGYVEDLDAHLFTTETSDAPDAIDSTPGRFLDSPPIKLNTDRTQLRTRQCAKGHAEAVLADLAANETIIPIADAVMFGTIGGGGLAIAGTTPDGAQSQLLAYTGVQHGGGGGSLVGPGGGPTAAPGLALVAGAGLGTGVYGYAYTDVTAAGESLPSPVGTVTTRAVISPPTAPTLNTTFPGSVLVGTFKYAVTFVTAAGETLPSALTTVGPSSVAAFQMSLPIGGATVIGRRLYRTVQGGSQLKLTYASPDNVATAYNDGTPDGSLGANAPTVDTTGGGNQVAVSGIAIGASPTTSRKVYRTAVGGSQLKLLATIADNTTTTYADSVADGSLGANAPTADASGISFVSTGLVLAGSTTILTTGAGPFAATGGWAIGGTNLIRYTGISGNTLTGIPASGVGAILTTMLYGSQILPAPALTGVTGNTLSMLKGTPVAIWVQRDDLAAQAVEAANDVLNGRLPADGIYDGPPIVDERRGEASLIQLCDVTLQLYSRPILTVTYATRDVKTKAGKVVHIDVASLGIGPYDLTIQAVDISEIDVSPGTAPRFSVTASSVRWTLEDLLRKALAAAA